MSSVKNVNSEVKTMGLGLWILILIVILWIVIDKENNLKDRYWE
ncbi:MAG: hypothetical protein ACXACY_26325 [Candidatus Hodarchaeales archaeon]